MRNAMVVIGIYVLVGMGFTLEGVYIEQTGSKLITNFWMSKGDQVMVSNIVGMQRVVLGENRETLEWEYLSGGDTSVVVQRRGNILKVSGKLKGERVEKSLAIDNFPWYEFLEVSLSDFVISGKEKTVFWILRPTDLTVYKMEAIREKEEEIEIYNSKVKAIRVRVTLGGPMSVFWKVFYWYDSKGLFLKYRGVNGGPGTPQTLIWRIQ